MKTPHTAITMQVVADEWVTFPGGELEGQRPTVTCGACRTLAARRLDRARPSAWPRPLCFQCYRSQLEHERALKAAGQFDTASEARFQSMLPFEPVNRARLAGLRAGRAAARVASREGVGQYGDKRRRAQIEARHALQRMAARMATCALPSARDRAFAEAVHAAELQLPEAWLPFVVAR